MKHTSASTHALRIMKDERARHRDRYMIARDCLKRGIHEDVAYATLKMARTWQDLSESRRVTAVKLLLRYEQQKGILPPPPPKLRKTRKARREMAAKNPDGEWADLISKVATE